MADIDVERVLSELTLEEKVSLTAGWLPQSWHLSVIVYLQRDDILSHVFVSIGAPISGRRSKSRWKMRDIEACLSHFEELGPKDTRQYTDY